MEESIRDLNLIQKLAKIRGMCDVAKKDMRGFNYTYADITKILAKVTAGMKKYEVSLVPCIDKGTANVELITYVTTKTDKTGKVNDIKNAEMLFTADMTFKWVNDSNPREFLEVPWFVTGEQPDPAQAMGTGLTYTMRQFLTSFFQIAQGDLDVDKYRSMQKEAEESENKAVAEAIVSEIDALIRSILQEYPEKSDEIKKLIGKYIKGVNYKAIKDPGTAADLLNAIKAEYIKEEE